MAEAAPSTAAPESAGGVLRLHALLERIWEVVGISVLWLLGCLPVITAATSTMALFRLVNQRRKGDYRPVTREFWHEFKRAPVARAGVSAVVLLAVFGVAQTFVAGMVLTDPTRSTVLQAAGLTGAVALIGAAAAALPLQAEFGGSLLVTLRRTVAVAFGRPGTTVVAVFLTAAIIVAVVMVPPLLLIAGWVWASLLTALSRSAVNRLRGVTR